jgi:beta-lactamase superfamily II metal-dependent hydrolase
MYGVGIHKRIRQFWHSGLQADTLAYKAVLQRTSEESSIVSIRQTAGAEFEFGDVKIVVLAPSIELRNRFETHHFNANNASIVLKVIYKDSVVILGGDAQFDSWSKVCEEFPRASRVRTLTGGESASDIQEANPLKCQVLKVAHHGSKHGTSLDVRVRKREMVGHNTVSLIN